MSDAMVWEVARRVCSPAELRALRKREDLNREGTFTWKRLAELCECSIGTARSRIQSAEAKIAGDGQVNDVVLEVEVVEDGRCTQVSPFGSRCVMEEGHEGWCRAEWGPNA